MPPRGRRRGDERPAELARRADRLGQIEAAMRRLEAQAKAEADAERQRRGAADAARQRTGKKRRGKAPPPVEDTPDDKAQSNFTEPELLIMRTNNKGWDYCGNAQASVDGACQIILARDVTDALHGNSRPRLSPKRRWQPWPTRVLSAPRTRRAPPRPSRPPGIMASTEAAVAVLGDLRVRSVHRHRAPGARAPQAEAPEEPATAAGAHGGETADASRAVRCTPDARSSWSRCLARSKQHVGSVGSAARFAENPWRMASGLPDA